MLPQATKDGIHAYLDRDLVQVPIVSTLSSRRVHARAVYYTVDALMWVVAEREQ